MKDGLFYSVDDLQRLAVRGQQADPRTCIGPLTRHPENEVCNFIAVEDIVQQPAGESRLADDSACCVKIQAQNSFGTSCTLNSVVRSVDWLRTPQVGES